MRQVCGEKHALGHTAVCWAWAGSGADLSQLWGCRAPGGCLSINDNLASQCCPLVVLSLQ